MANRADHRVVVVGAGAFGAWTARHLLHCGAEVFLVDPWGPGNSRSSSGGETRVIRHLHPYDDFLTGWAVDAMRQWQEVGQTCDTPLFERRGLLWLVAEDNDEPLESALAILKARGIPFDRLGGEDVRHRYPQICCDDVRWAAVDHGAGVLSARRACREIVRAAVADGAELIRASALPGQITGNRLDSVVLHSGIELRADHFVFCGGPWSAQLFPDLTADLIRVTRQEVLYFGTPADSELFCDSVMPVWASQQDRFWYGIPGNDYRGFKVADDSPGPAADPTLEDRCVAPETVRRYREFLSRRFPALANAPLVESRVCQYTRTDNGDFLIDQHPYLENVRLACAGNGHGFKHSPVIGETVAKSVMQNAALPDRFRLTPPH